MTPPPQTLDALYADVSLAIHRAEVAEASGDAGLAASMYLDASYREEEIAERRPASDTEGAIARRGAVSAALRAQQFERARVLADRYLGADDATPGLRTKLLELRRAALQGLDAVEAFPDRIEPSARFHFAA
jgi:hypothetical protein